MCVPLALGPTWKMVLLLGISLALLCNCFVVQVSCQGERTEATAQVFFDEVNRNYSSLRNRYSKLAWAAVLDLENQSKRDAESALQLEAAALDKELAMEAKKWNYESFVDPILKKGFGLLTDLGVAALPSDKFKELSDTQIELETIYGTGEVCTSADDCKSLEPDLVRIMSKSEDYDELLWAWSGWRNATGRKMKELYANYVKLLNEGAVLNGYADAGESWRSNYIPSPEPSGPKYDFQEDLERLNEQMSPLYRVIHRYVKDKLKEMYGADKFPSTGHIPAHLLGNMWAQSWGNLFQRMKPFPDVTTTLDITPKLESMTVLEMVETAEDFFTSLGLFPMTDEFWDNSVFERLPNTSMVCHASAWDFLDGKDFRIKQCTDKTLDDFSTIHHEMGHIQYYQQYKILPALFRRGANPGFHEALGDLIGLSVTTPKHLKEIGFLTDYVDTPEGDMNYLMSIALDKISFLPFAKLMDDWRWNVFNGNIKPEDYNKEWWSRRCKYQGLSPPIERTEMDFDPGAKYHIPASVPYVRYLVSYILQFQLYRSLCETTGHTGPLYKCDFYNSKEAGDKLSEMMRRGQQEDWQTILETATGSRQMDATAIVEYFQPLIDYILKETGQTSADSSYFDWDDSCPGSAGAATLVCSSNIVLILLSALLIVMVKRL